MVKLHVSILSSIKVLEKTELTLNKWSERWSVRIPPWLTYWFFSAGMMWCPSTVVSALDIPSVGAVTGSFESVLLLFWLNKRKYIESRVFYQGQIWLDMDNDFKNSRIFFFPENSWRTARETSWHITFLGNQAKKYTCLF